MHYFFGLHYFGGVLTKCGVLTQTVYKTVSEPKLKICRFCSPFYISTSYYKISALHLQNLLFALRFWDATLPCCIPNLGTCNYLKIPMLSKRCAVIYCTPFGMKVRTKRCAGNYAHRYCTSLSSQLVCKTKMHTIIYYH